MVNNKIDKVTNLFTFLKAYHSLKSPVVANEENREWLENVSNWPKHPYIEERWQNPELGKPICIIKKPTEAMIEKKDGSSQVEAIYNSLYNVYTRLRKEPELLELVYGNGQLQLEGMERIDHPLLLQVVELVFDSENEAFALVLTNKMPELYEGILGLIEGMEEEAIIELIKVFKTESISPLDKKSVQDFCDKVEAQLPKESNVEIVSDYPTLFLRKKQLGFHLAIDGILEDLQKRKQIPPFIADIVGEGDSIRKNSNTKETGKKVALDVNGIDQKILFTKPANKEQL